MDRINYCQQCIKKIGQVTAKPNVPGTFARSPNLLIWLLEQKYKTKCKRFGLWIIRKVIAYFQPYFFYTKRCITFKKNFENNFEHFISDIFWNYFRTRL